MRALWVLVVMVEAACIDDHLVPCGTNLCPSNKVCDGYGSCVFQAQLDACNGVTLASACSYDTLADGTCDMRGVCIPSGCGNGVVEPDKGEVCDDGNNRNGDSCSADCMSNATCGNGVVDLAEQCDDGNTVSGDGCQSNCQLPRCGDGVRDPFEQCDDGNDRGRDGCSACKIEDIAVLAPGASPTARKQHAMAYDAARQRVVMFGSSTALNETWEWSGAGWMRLHPVHSPVGRAHTALAYDAHRHRVVMFGGDINNGTTMLDDTNEWDGNDWVRMVPAHKPAARTGAAMVYDPARGHVVMFGGKLAGTAGVTDEMWEWDGDNDDWLPITPSTVPGKRAYAAMAYDPRHQAVVLFGGLSESVTWIWDGATWTSFATTNPPFSSMVMAFDVSRQHVVAYTGSNIYDWDGDGLAWTQIMTTMPQSRDDTAIAYDVVRKQLVLFGGYSAGPLADTALMSSDNAGTATWSGAAWTEPSQRFRAGATYDPLGGRVVLFGGVVNNVGNNETWLWDGRQWTSVPSGPISARTGACLDYDVAAGKIVLFGGEIRDSSTPGNGNGSNSNTDMQGLADLWWFGADNTWTPQTANTRTVLRNNAMVYDRANNRVVTFGGRKM